MKDVGTEIKIMPPATCKTVIPVHVPQGLSCARFHALVRGDGNENLKYLQELPRCDVQYSMSTSPPDFVVKAEDPSALNAAVYEIKDLLHHVMDIAKEKPLPSEHDDDETTTAASTPRNVKCHDDSWTGWHCWTCGLTVGASTPIQALQEAKSSTEIGRPGAVAVVDANRTAQQCCTVPLTDTQRRVLAAVAEYNKTAPEGWQVPMPERR